VTAFTTKRELQTYLRRRLGTFAAPLLLFPVELTTTVAFQDIVCPVDTLRPLRHDRQFE
jgi:hypothetical protein